MQYFLRPLGRLRSSVLPLDDRGYDALTESGQPVISVVVVCFHSASPLNYLLAGLRRSDCLPLFSEIILVNNSADDTAEVERIATDYGCQIIQNSENVGYGAACNQGALAAESELILFLNPDVLLSKASIKMLAGASLAVKDGVAFGPVIYDQGRRRRSKKISIADPQSAAQRVKTPTGIVPTAYISGCAFMVRRDAFVHVGGFDESIFLYYEDDDICIRLRQLGSLNIVDSAVALHSHGRSANDPEKWRQLRAKSLGYSMAYVLMKHRGAAGAAIALTRIVLRCVSPLNLLSGRYRTKTLHMTSGAFLALKKLGWGAAPKKEKVA